MPPVVVPMPATCTGILCARASCIAVATVPLHAWPSEITRNALGLPLLPNTSSSFSTSRSPQRMPFLDVGVPRRRVLEAERRAIAEVIDEEEQRVGILRQPDLRCGELREQRQRHAVALPAQGLGEGAQELHRAAPAIRADVGDIHRRRRVLQDDDVGAGLAERGDARLRPRDRGDAEAGREQHARPERQIANRAETLTHRQHAPRRQAAHIRAPADDAPAPHHEQRGGSREQPEIDR